MHGYITRATRVFVAAAVSAGLSIVGVTGASASGMASPAPHAVRVSSGQVSAKSGATLWVKRYSDPSGAIEASSVAVSPLGGRVFVTGFAGDSASVFGMGTVAYNTATGARLWAQHYNDGGVPGWRTYALAVSPSGQELFVTGVGNNGFEYATVAYNATTGAQLWVKRWPRYYNDTGGASIAVSRTPTSTGGTVFVTGLSSSTTSGSEYATVAYDAATGAQLWVKRYGPSNGLDGADAVAVSPAGTTVFVTGYSASTSGDDYATVAYNAATGAQLWAKRYNTGPAGDSARASSVAVSPTGTKVFVTGSSSRPYSGIDYATVAYNATTGTQLWVKRYNGPAGLTDKAVAVAVGRAPTSTAGTVFVTGNSIGTGSIDYATVAYNATTGAQLWAKRYSVGGDNEPAAMAVSPTGAKVYVTGSSDELAGFYEYVTVAYNAASGNRLWVNRYFGPGSATSPAGSLANSVAVSPTNGTVFVTGSSTGANSEDDYATIAYNG